MRGLLPLVPYLCDLLPATPAGQIPPGSVAFIRKTNVFYHPFHPRVKAETETRSVPALPGGPRCRVLPGARSAPSKWGRRGRGGGREPAAVLAFA